ncbi:hypothetical protein HWV62_19503 [Athelia sp. TMB]|nr:hypothetical protein HWV62_19503 [Athelia sp. TMB]
MHKETCFSEKRINAMLDKINAEEAAKPPPKPKADQCTGCGVKFPQRDEDDEDEDMEEDGEEALADACDDCAGLMGMQGTWSVRDAFRILATGAATALTPILETRTAACVSLNEYISLIIWNKAPRWYHGGRGKSYRGDRHPEGEREEDPSKFEATPRACGNCGEVDYCMKKAYLK